MSGMQTSGDEKYLEYCCSMAPKVRAERDAHRKRLPCALVVLVASAILLLATPVASLAVFLVAFVGLSSSIGYVIGEKLRYVQSPYGLVWRMSLR